MSINHLPQCAFLVLFLATVVSAASAQGFPRKPIRLVASETGGGNDVVARIIAPGLGELLGQQVIVDNRPAGVIQGQTVYHALPDGYTLLFGGAPHWLMSYMRDRMPFDPVKDFAPVSSATTSPNILVVHPSVTAKSVKELIALAKARPGELNYSRAGAGGPSHLAGELFKSLAGVDIVSIPFKGSGPAVISLLSAQVQLMFATAPSVAPHVKSGKVIALVVTSAAPSALFPELPTVAASGLPGYRIAAIYGVLVPAKTPDSAIQRLNQDVVRVLSRQDVKEKLANIGVESAGSSPGEFAATINSEMALLGKVIKNASVRAE